MATPRQAGRVAVQVVCVAGGRDFTKDMLVPVGQTVGWCINASGLPARMPEMAEAKVGVWGKPVAREAVVADGDRIEVYVPVRAEAVVRARRLKGGRASEESAAKMGGGIAVAADLGDNGE